MFRKHQKKLRDSTKANPKRICFVAPKAYSIFNPSVDSVFGGAQVQVFFFANELAKQEDLSVHVMVADYGQSTQEMYGKVNVWKALNFSQPLHKRIWSFWRTMRAVRADVYIERTLTFFSLFIAWMAKRQGALFVHMVSSQHEIDKTHDLYLGPFRFLAYRFFRSVPVIIAQAEYQQKIIREHFNRNAPIIKNGYPIPKKYTIRNRRHVLWVARCMPLKRPEVFLRLAKRFPDEHFVMICPPARDDFNFWTEIGKQAKSILNIEFIEYVPFSDIDEYFAKAKVIVNTSTKEGFPNTFIQGAMNGVPSISLNVNPDDILNHYNFGFCANDSEEKLASALNDLLNDRDLYATQCRNAYKYAKKDHDIVRNAKKLKDLILL